MSIAMSDYRRLSRYKYDYKVSPVIIIPFITDEIPPWLEADRHIPLNTAPILFDEITVSNPLNPVKLYKIPC